MLAVLLSTAVLLFLSLCAILCAGCFLVCKTGDRAVLRDLAVLVRAVAALPLPRVPRLPLPRSRSR